MFSGLSMAKIKIINDHNKIIIQKKLLWNNWFKQIYFITIESKLYNYYLLLNELLEQ